MSHRCRELSRRLVELQQKAAILDLPFKWVQDDYGYIKLLRIQEEVEDLEEQLRRENRCLACGALR